MANFNNDTSAKKDSSGRVKGSLFNRILLIAICIIGIYLILISDLGQFISQANPYRAIESFLLWDHTPTSLALLLFAYALYLIFNYYIDIYAPLQKEIEKVSSIISSRRDPQTFTKDFEIIDDAFRDCRSFREGWREFTETLHKTAHETSGNEVYHNSRRPHDYLNERSISQSGIEIRNLEFYPGIFVAVGLVLTFIGLLVALHSAGDAIAITGAGETGTTADALKEEDEVTAALKQLIGASAFKFITSISGIGCSILLTIVSRRFVQKLSGALLSLLNQLERALIHLSVEKIQLRVESETAALAQGIRDGFSEAIMKEAGNELRLFADRMGTIGDELQKAEKIVNQLGDTYQIQLKKIITAFISTTEETADQAKIFQTEISKNQNMFSEKLSRQYEEQFGRIGDVFSNNFDNVQNRLSEFQTAVQTKLVESKSELSETSSQIVNASKDHLAEQAAEIGRSVEGVFREAQVEFSKLKEIMDNNYETLITGLSKSNETFLEASTQQIEEHSDSISERYRRLGEDIAGSVRSASDGFTENIGTRFEALSEMTETLMSATEKALKDHNSLQDRSNAIIQSIDSVARNLGAVKEEIVNVSERNTSQLAKTGEKLDGAASTIQEFSGNVQTKTDAEFERLVRTISGLETAIKGHLSQTVNSADTGRALSGSLETAVKQFTEQNSQSQEALVLAMTNLGEALAAATNKIADTQSSKSILGNIWRKP